MVDVILVDRNDKELGTMEKMLAHQQGKLHRAVSGFVFDDKKLLLQQRALTKYHTPGIWSNTVCSHPFINEDPLAAVTRRLSEEMGFVTDFHEVGTILYRAKFNNGLIEHELDHIFVSQYDAQKIHPNPDEVGNYRWITRKDLEAEIKQHPERFSPWMQLIIKQDFMKKYF